MLYQVETLQIYQIIQKKNNNKIKYMLMMVTVWKLSGQQLTLLNTKWTKLKVKLQTILSLI